MAPRVRDRLPDDADERLPLVRRDLRSLADIDRQLDADAPGHLLGGLHEGDLERLVDGPRQGRDRAPRLVQRALGAPNETVARQGSIFAAFLKLFPVYLFIIPGLICYALAKSGKVPELTQMIGPDGNAIPAVSNGAFPMMVQYLLPPGIRGIVVAGLLSALMGSLAGVFNACSTLVRQSSADSPGAP